MDANKHFFNFNNANLIYNNINISYYRLHGCLFGSSVPNLQSPCYSMAPSDYNTAAKSNRFGTQDKPNKNVIRTWATTQEKSIQRISRPK